MSRFETRDSSTSAWDGGLVSVAMRGTSGSSAGRSSAGRPSAGRKRSEDAGAGTPPSEAEAPGRGGLGGSSAGREGRELKESRPEVSFDPVKMPPSGDPGAKGSGPWGSRLKSGMVADPPAGEAA